MARITLELSPCWGRRGAEICTGCELLQMPADYSGSFPAMQMLLPAVENIGTDAEFCPNRLSAGMVGPGPSVGVDQKDVGGRAHPVTVRPAQGVGVSLHVGSLERAAACADARTGSAT